MTNARRDQAARDIERRIASLLLRNDSDGITVCVKREYIQGGVHATDTWSGDLEGFAMRMAIAAHGNDDQADGITRRIAPTQAFHSEEKDTHTGSQPVWAGFTAREEIIGNLIAAGYNEAAAKELLDRADREPHASAIEDEFASTLAGGHALVFEDIGTDERLATCQCGRRLGSVGTPGSSARTGIWFLAWKSHLSTEVSS
ncbi:hypothetical protein [Streptomyces sp. NPDC006285]|uniref:hypothetical protein n=1 Tax=Streptomyces sp. NPDC006285 TaxID=3364742 RepID=UPI0036AD2B9F